jgi:hypothetical protein
MESLDGPANPPVSEATTPILNSSWENALPGIAQNAKAAAAIDTSDFLNMIAPPKPTGGFPRGSRYGSYHCSTDVRMQSKIDFFLPFQLRMF